jgi:hypothetical protein
MVMKVGVGELSCHVDAHFSSYIFNCFFLLFFFFFSSLLPSPSLLSSRTNDPYCS